MIYSGYMDSSVAVCIDEAVGDGIKRIYNVPCLLVVKSNARCELLDPETPQKLSSFFAILPIPHTN
jgi:hypothetical protein